MSFLAPDHVEIELADTDGTSADSGGKAEEKIAEFELPPCFPISLKWDGLSLDVKPKATQLKKDPTLPTTKRILSGVSGSVEPSHLVAIMGSSGAGKSTLLNALSKRIAVTEGSVSWNGKPCDLEFTRRSAYVQQEDMFFGHMTVKEHLMFCAKLRLDLTMDEKAKRVEMILDRLGLKKCESHMIGNLQQGMTRGISGGEKKRLAFASEIITNPSLLFADEPTSGLDTFMAGEVVQVMKELAMSGRTVLATIHQPSSKIYSMFDQVMFMAEGRLVYYGWREAALVWFERLGYPCPTYSNPGDFYIELLANTGPEKLALINRFADHWETYGAEFNKEQDAIHDPVEQVSPKNEDMTEIYTANWLVQFTTLLYRAVLTTLRNPILTVVQLVQAIVLGVITGLIYLQLKNDQAGVQNRNGAIFFILINQCMPAIFGILQTFPVEKPIAQREVESANYSITPYYLARVIADLPFQILFPTIFYVVAYWMIGLHNAARPFLLSWVILLLSTNAAGSIGYLISCAAKTVGVALAVAPMVFVPFILFGGFFINAASIHVAWSWLEYLSFFKYGFSGMAISIWTGYSIGCDNPLTCRYTTGEEVLDALSLPKKNFTRDWAALLGMVVGYRVLALGFLWVSCRKKQNS
eukprot:Platyproteum_vivax@DN7556_c0_g1_i3.p1